MAWEYKREEQQFAVLPEGDYRIRVKAADKAMSSKGNDMLVLQFEVSGKKNILYHYITFLDDKPEITNRNLTQFFDSFKDIPEGDFNMNNWIGKVGACHVKHEDYNGSPSAKINYFINVSRQAGLPAWTEPDGTEVDENGFAKIAEEDLPDFI